MDKLRVVALICPDCGSQLAGLSYDQIFFCRRCGQGLAPGEKGAWTKHPLSFAKLDNRPQADIIYLPFWQIAIQAQASCVNQGQEIASRLLAELRSVWVPGFTLTRASYFGDLGVLYTEKRVSLKAEDQIPSDRAIVGCSRTMEDVNKYVRLYVTLILDKRADVTGMDINIATRDAKLWAVPFADYGDKIVDLLTGTELPAFALDDIQEIRKFGRKG